MTAPLVTFLSDYGLADEFVGVCHAVIARRCPSARIIDLTHGIPRHDVRAGALALAGALPFTAPGIHLAIVDPGVGSGRRAVAARTNAEARVLVGPDNGLLMEAARLYDGVREAFDIGSSAEVLAPPSATFHGRDVFAPVAAALADGVAIERLGEPLDPAGLATLTLPQAQLDGLSVIAHAVTIDAYGNVSIDATPELLAAAGVEAGGALLVSTGAVPVAARWARTFSDVGEGALLIYTDARGTLALAVNGGSAAKRLGVSVDEELGLRAL